MVVSSMTLAGAHAKLGEVWLKSETVFPEKSYLWSTILLRPTKHYDHRSHTWFNTLNPVANSIHLSWIDHRKLQTPICQLRAKQRAVAAMKALPLLLLRVCLTRRGEKELCTDTQ
jgi:hypothetical protein